MALVVCRIPRICVIRACRSMGGGPVDTLGGGFGLGVICSISASCATLIRLVLSITTCMDCGHPVALSMLPSPSLKLIMITFVDVSCFPP